METQSNGKGRKILLIFILIALLGLCVLCFLCTLSFLSIGSDSGGNLLNTNGLEYEYVTGDINSNNKLLMIPITGVILNEKPDDILSLLYTDVTYGYEVSEIFEKASLDTSIKGIILAIDSPGGTVTGSKAISDGASYYRSVTSNPIVAHIMGMGASGGYWAAASSDHIVADSGSMVGSIGVIFGPFKYYDKVLSESNVEGSVATENGIDTYYITSGEYKDFGNPYRMMSEDEKQIMQEDTNDVYEEFVSFISTRRNIPSSKIRSDIKALPYGNDRALELNLIDETGSRQSAYDYLSEETSLGSDYQVVRTYEDVDFFSLFFTSLLMDKKLEANNDFVSNELKNKMLYLYGTPLDF